MGAYDYKVELAGPPREKLRNVNFCNWRGDTHVFSVPVAHSHKYWPGAIKGQKF